MKNEEEEGEQKSLLFFIFGIFKDRTMKNIMRKVGFLFNLFVKYDTFILSNLFYLKSSLYFFYYYFLFS